MARIGFIGVGNMGGPMAQNLMQKGGHAVAVFDLSAEAVARCVAAGATAAPTAIAAVREADVVVTMLPAGEHVKRVYLGAAGILAAAKRGTLFIDSSTIDVESARTVAAEAAKAGMDMVDAPVSGGTAGAAGATLTFMVGGSDTAFTRAAPILETMGKTVVHAGASGNGQAAKICNNMILGISMIAVSEAFVLAETLGLDHQKLFDISSKSSGQCWSLTSYCPVPGPVPASPANRGYKPGFTADMMLKDLRLAQAAAHGAGAHTALGEQAMRLYERYAGAGQGGTDFSGIIEMVRKGSA
jgi:3-hydroxyisobutyrate dehydrogenase